jgi:uroporphyrinogen-III synthase
VTEPPLAGRAVIVTRPRDEAEELAAPLRQLGADVLVAPAIRIEPGHVEALRRAAREAEEGGFEWVAFTSAAGVRAWFEHADVPPKARVAAVGAGTAESLRGRGVEPDLVPPTFTTSALGEAFPEGQGRVLLPRADLATDQLERALAAKGWTAVRVEAYRIRHQERLPEEVERALAADRVDAVTFTSASTVEGFARVTEARPPAVCIGPVTAEAAMGREFPVAGVAEPHTVTGLIDALLDLFGWPAAG